MKQYAIQPANLEFNAEGTPVSRDFDDVYFSNDNGLEETRYVFLGGNHLAQRFPAHSRPLFVVAESGFGTGLNFLTLWQAFAEFRDTYPDATLERLHFISFEKFPLTREDLTLAHQHWPELAPWATALQEQWPLPLAGCHRLLLDEGRVTLDLWFGDINELTSKLDDSLNQKVDAWFLDGFVLEKIRICGRQRCLTQWPVWLAPAARWRPSPQQALCVGDCRKPGLRCKNAKALVANEKCFVA